MSYPRCVSPEAPRETELPITGELFADRYRIEARLDGHGREVVYRAHDLAVDELVTLEIRPQLDSAGLEQFRRQARLARRVTHRNVARTYDIGEHRGLRYLTTEWIEGRSLGEWRRERPSASEILDVASQIAAGLAAMHAAEVVHRGLDPQTILIERGGRVVISAFERAGVFGEPFDAARSGDSSYAAPELRAGEAVDGRADLHALGLILVEMFSESSAAMIAARLEAEGTLPESLGEVPTPLHEPLARCLARDPVARYPSAIELAAALAHARAQLEPETIEQPAASPQDTHPTPRTVARAKALAVLPFRFRGPAEQRFIADALLDVLTDVLSMTRGLKVSGSGATSRFADVGDRDPRVLGVELGVDVVVDGSIQLAGKRLRIAARLLDVHTGFQLWSERFDGELEDVFELQDKLGQRIAEALRVELEIISHGGLADPEAIESYLRARQAKLRWRLRGPEGAVVHYQRVLAQAPDFRPAIAGYALALMRAWFLPAEHHDEHFDWAGEAAAAVERAMSEAPEFPESRIAAASWAVQRGDYRSGASHLREALRVAPTCALAHEYLGRLQVEAAQPDKGLRHLTLALELDPQLEWCHADIARLRALQGDLASCREHMDRLLERTERLHAAAHLQEMRIGAWTRDLAQIRRALAQLDADSPDESVRTMRGYGPPLLSPYDPEALARFHARATEQAQNGRLRTLLYQLWAEQTGFWADRERTLAHLEAAADLVLVDLAWLDGCPLFEFVRDDPRFVELRARVRARCEAIWAAD
ncbi:MAG: protein kinase [Enhygromyxa sp.]